MLRLRPIVVATLLLAAVSASAVRAEWLQPDPSLRNALDDLRYALRDTAGHGEDTARLDSVAVLLMRVGRLDEAAKLYDRVAAMDPADAGSRAGRGKLALFNDEPARAESLLAGLEANDPGAASDLFAARLRRGEYAAAAGMAAVVNQDGRRALLERLAERAPYEVTGGPQRAVVPFASTYPVVLVSAKLNGERVLVAIDTGIPDLIVDDMYFRRLKVQPVTGQRTMFWSGSRTVVNNAIVQKFELGGMQVANCPAGVRSLGRWSIEVNPHGERVAAIVGLNFLRQFGVTLDYRAMKLELRRAGVAPVLAADAARVPFQLWGENELTVYGTIAQGRRVAMVVATGVPGCGIGAPQEVFDEMGVKPGALAKVAKGAGAFLQGRPWAAVVVPSVTVGTVARDKVAGWSGALDSSELWRHGVRRDALLSHDFFRGRRVTFDWDRHELVFEGDATGT